MTTRRQQLLAALVASSAMYMAVFIVVLIHEAGHALTAAMFGASVPLLQLHPFGGRTIVDFPIPSPRLHLAMTEAMGCIATVVATVVAAITHRRLAHLSFGSVLAACVVAIGAVASLVSAFPGGGEITQAAMLLNLGRPTGRAAAFVLTGVVLWTLRSYWMVFRRQLVAGWRELALLSFVALTFVVFITSSMAMNGSGYTIGRKSLGFVSIACLAVLALFAWGVGRIRTLNTVYAQSLSTAAPFCAMSVITLLLVQIFAFGVDRTSPRGVFFSRSPREVAVRTCNFVITGVSSSRYQLSAVMRPFHSSHFFLWDRLQNSDPVNWSVYERFASKAATEILPARSVMLLGHSSDPRVPMFVEGRVVAGARTVQAIIDLEPSLAASKVLLLKDFWFMERVGTLDKVYFSPPPQWSIASVAPSGPDVRWSVDHVEWHNGRTVRPVPELKIALEPSGRGL